MTFHRGNVVSFSYDPDHLPLNQLYLAHTHTSNNIAQAIKWKFRHFFWKKGSWNPFVVRNTEGFPQKPALAWNCPHVYFHTALLAFFVLSPVFNGYLLWLVTTQIVYAVLYDPRHHSTQGSTFHHHVSNLSKFTPPTGIVSMVYFFFSTNSRHAAFLHSCFVEIFPWMKELMNWRHISQNLKFLVKKTFSNDTPPSLRLLPATWPWSWRWRWRWTNQPMQEQQPKSRPLQAVQPIQGCCCLFVGPWRASSSEQVCHSGQVASPASAFMVWVVQTSHV